MDDELTDRPSAEPRRRNRNSFLLDDAVDAVVDCTSFRGIIWASSEFLRAGSF